jgi:hypothetical protein
MAGALSARAVGGLLSFARPEAIEEEPRSDRGISAAVFHRRQYLYERRYAINPCVGFRVGRAGQAGNLPDRVAGVVMGLNFIRLKPDN